MNVVQLPVSNLNDIPKMARRFADDIEAGEYGEVTATFVVIETNDGLHCFGWGDTDDPFRNIGLLEAAKQMQLELALPD